MILDEIKEARFDAFVNNDGRLPELLDRIVQQIERHDVRVAELLTANNAEVERRRAAEKKVANLEMQLAAMDKVANDRAETIRARDLTIKGLTDVLHATARKNAELVERLEARV